MKTFRKLRGTQDVLPDRSAVWQRVFTRMRGTLESYGYPEIRTPIFEETQLFVRGVGEDTDIVQKEMFTFTDRKGRSLSLRPEGTACVVRAYLENHLHREAGTKRFHYIGPMFRYDRPQAGRYREFFQVGAEALDNPLPEQDVEIIDLMMTLLRDLGLEELAVQVNSVGNPESRRRYEVALQEALRQRRGDLCATCVERIERNPLRVLDCKNAACQAQRDTLPRLAAYLDAEDQAHLDAVLAGLDALGIPWQREHFLVRGLDYYTRTAFEVHYPPLGAQSALGGGGRYDGLVEACGGPPTPGVGFSAGIERILFALERTHPERVATPPGPPVAVLPLDAGSRREALRLAGRLRRVAPTCVDLSGRSLKAQLRSASKEGARIAVLLGEEERRAAVATVRDLARGEQARHPLDALPGVVRAALKRDEAGAAPAPAHEEEPP